MRGHDKWYLAALVAIAALILAGGYALKPPKTSPVDTVVSESERFRLQMLAQKRSLQNAGEYFSDLAGQASVHVVGLRGGSGVVWNKGMIVAAPWQEEDGASLRSATGMVPVKERLAAPSGGVSVLIPATEQTAAAIVAGHPPEPGAWIVAVSRRLDGTVAFLQGTAGGLIDTTCGTLPVQGIVSNLPKDALPTGAGLFDLDGRLTGVALKCADHDVTLVTASSVQKLLDSVTSPENRLANRLGLRAVRLTAGLAGQFGAAEGLLVHEVWDGYAASLAGLRPGDVLVEANGQLLTSPSILQELTATPGRPTELALLRQRRAMRVLLAQAGPGSGPPPSAVEKVMRLEAPPEYPLVARIPTGSRAEAAGLRAGDQVVECNGRPPRASELARIEAQIEGRDPVFLVVRRPGYLAGVFVQ